MPSICLLIPAEAMALIAEELIPEVQKNPGLFDKAHSFYKNPVMHADMLFALLESQ